MKELTSARDVELKVYIEERRMSPSFSPYIGWMNCTLIQPADYYEYFVIT